MNILIGSGSVFDNQTLVAKVTYSLQIITTRTGQESIIGSIKVIKGGDNFQIQNQLILDLEDHNRKFLFQFKRPHPKVIDPNYQILINQEIFD